MKYKEFGGEENPTILLLHGEWLSWWSFQEIVDALKAEYRIVVPVIDGHGEDGATTFPGIQETARKIIGYIDANCRGRVCAICGVSLGGQIAVEILSERPEITEYAVVESAPVVPHRAPIRAGFATTRLAYRLSRLKWLARIRAKALCVVPGAFSRYYQDRLRISYGSWRNVKRSRAGYAAPAGLGMSGAKVLVVIGAEEIEEMDPSVRLFMSTVRESRICIVPDMGHGELSLAHCTEYLALIKHFMMCPREHKTREPL